MNKRLKIYFLMILLVPVLCLGIFSVPKPAYAQPENQVQITISGPENVAIGNLPDFIEFTAVLSDTNNYSADQIVWTINQSEMIFYNATVFGNSSVLKIDKSNYENIINTTTWNVVAKINDDILATHTTVFGFTDIETVSIKVLGPLVQDVSENIVPVILEANFTGSPQQTFCEWYQKTYTNKFVKLPVTANSYTFTPSLPGKYIFKLCVNGVFSQDKEIILNYKPVTELKIKCNQVTDNANNLDRYIFSLENVDRYNDLSKINWYVSGVGVSGTGLVQQGGSTLDFQVRQYGTYRVYATYVDEETYTNVQSESYSLEISINRTKEILIGCGIGLAVMTVFLVIGSIRMVKRDRIF